MFSIQNAKYLLLLSIITINVFAQDLSQKTNDSSIIKDLIIELPSSINKSNLINKSALSKFSVEIENQKILPNDGAAGNSFGYAVSVNGNRALIGSDGSKSAYIFELEGAIWVQKAKITNNASSFGWSVSLYGDRALIGSLNNNVYVYDKVGDNWMLSDTLIPNANPNGFGWSVSLFGDRVLIGDPYHVDFSNNQTGAAYIFDFDGKNWSQTGNALLPLLPGNGDHFGWSVSLSGDRALIGAPENDDSGSNAGSAYVFEIFQDNWFQAHKLNSSNFSSGLGWSVSLEGNRALVGTRTASAYVFTTYQPYNNYTEKQILPLNSNLYIADFGYSVSLSGDYALIGDPLNFEFGTNSGAAFLYKLNNDNWQQLDRFVASDAAAGDFFGEVSFSNNNIIVGAFSNDDNGNGSGAAYAYSLDDYIIDNIFANSFE